MSVSTTPRKRRGSQKRKARDPKKRAKSESGLQQSRVKWITTWKPKSASWPNNWPQKRWVSTAHNILFAGEWYWKWNHLPSFTLLSVTTLVYADMQSITLEKTVKYAGKDLKWVSRLVPLMPTSIHLSTHSFNRIYCTRTHLPILTHSPQWTEGSQKLCTQTPLKRPPPRLKRRRKKQSVLLLR